MANNQKKNPTEYTYESVDGTRTTLQIGKDGVTKKWLTFLMTEDAALLEQEDYWRKHLDYGYQNAQTYYEYDPDDEAEHPLDQIPDPGADIFRILFPETPENHPLLTRVEAAMEQLTDEQRDLIYELFGLGRTIAEVAREQHVTGPAIRNRRTKILNRIQKNHRG